MQKKKIANWINHPQYFMLWFFIGLAAWSYCFYSPKNDLYQIQLSSLSTEESAIQDSSEFETLSKMSNEEILKELEKNKFRWSYKIHAELNSSAKESERLLVRNHKTLPKRFRANPMFQILNHFTDDEAQVNFEDPIVCDKSRQFYEKDIVANVNLAELRTQRDNSNEKISVACLTHIMNTYPAQNVNFAYCEKSSSAARIPGAKPCVTSNLVNLTYNSYLDVANCLDIDPRNLVPKIDNDSGFLLNSFSADRESGIGQLGDSLIAEANAKYDEYFEKIESLAPSNPACARILKNKNLVAKLSVEPEQKCSIMAVPENPLRNVLYLAIAYKSRREQIENFEIKNKNIKEKLEKLGLKNPDLSGVVEILTQLSLKMNLKFAVEILNSYLEARLREKLPLALSDFDFNNPKIEKDITGENLDVVSIARQYVLSSFISPMDSQPAKLLKASRRKMLPQLWSRAHTKTFPEYLTYRSNSYDGMSLKPYLLYGVPGYLNLLAERSKTVRSVFTGAELDADRCVFENFLNLKSINK